MNPSLKIGDLVTVKDGTRCFHDRDYIYWRNFKVPLVFQISRFSTHGDAICVTNGYGLIDRSGDYGAGPLWVKPHNLVRYKKEYVESEIHCEQ